MIETSEMVWRLLNAGLAVLALVLLLYGALTDWKRLVALERLWVYSLAGLLSLVAVSSIESWLQGNSVGFRDHLATVACMWIVVALGMHFYQRRADR